jgi:hypothetical protein
MKKTKKSCECGDGGECSPKTVALEDLVTCVLTSFFENQGKLGHVDTMSEPAEESVTVWYKDLSDKEKFRVSGKLLEIMEGESEEGAKGG